MPRLRDYVRLLVWQTGLSYLALWAITLWTLNSGAAVFGGSGVCHPDAAKVLFYWVCDPASPLSILAAVANVALTVTVWAPVYVAAATVLPGAMFIAVPIVAVHLLGLPLGILVLVRLLVKVLDARHWLPGRRRRGDLGHDAGAAAPGPERAAVPLPVRPQSPAASVPSRELFGLRVAMPLRQPLP